MALQGIPTVIPQHGLVSPKDPIGKKEGDSDSLKGKDVAVQNQTAVSTAEKNDNTKTTVLRNLRSQP